MWAGKILCGIMLLLFVFSGCGLNFNVTGSLYDAIDAGIIVPPGAGPGIAGAEDEPITVSQVVRGDFTRNVELPISLRFPIEYIVSFEHTGGVFSGPLVPHFGTWVYEGQLLGYQLFPHDTIEPTVLAYHRLLFDIEQFEERTASELNVLLAEIDDLHAEIDIAPEADLEILNLRVEALELRIERFLRSSAMARANLHERLEDIEVFIYGERIYSPTNGFISFITWEDEGSIVTGGAFWNINRIFCDSVVDFVITTAIDIIRLGNFHTVRGFYDGYPIEGFKFELKVVSDPLVHIPVPTVTEIVLRPVDENLLETLDVSLYELWRTDLRIIVDDVLARDVLMIPQSAVRIMDLTPYVYLYENGGFIQRFITLGLSTAFTVQVIAGLEEGEWILSD